MSSALGPWTRREWLRLTGLAVAGHGLGVQAADRRKLGAQLYTVRDLLPERALETLRAIAAMGYEEVEVVRADAERIVSLAREAGLSPVSVHIEAPFVTGNWAPHRDAARAAGRALPADLPSFERLAADIRAMGPSHAVVAYLLPAERGKDGGAYRALADQLNRAGEVAKRTGLTLGYHNHGFEFVPLADGQRGFEVLAKQLDPSLVTLEVDVFWVAMADGDPAPLIRQLDGRVSLLHLKDKAKGVTAEADEAKVPREAFAEVGAGSLDFRAILAAADAAGVRHVFVEQDQTPDPLASLRRSAAYLRSPA